MKRFALPAALLLSVAFGAAAAVRTGSPARGPVSLPTSDSAGDASRCPWLAAHATASGEVVLPDADHFPARPSAGGRCPVTGAGPAAGVCPRAGIRPASPHPFLSAAGGGVV